MSNPLKSQRRQHFSDYLGGSSIGPQVMSDEKWEEVKESFKVREQECYVCKKRFTPANASEWAYRTPTRIFCSWSCLRKNEKAEEEKKAKRKRRWNDEQLD